MSLLIIILENVINKEFKINIRKDILMLGKSRVKRILKMYRVNIKNKFLKKKKSKGKRKYKMERYFY